MSASYPDADGVLSAGLKFSTGSLSGTVKDQTGAAVPGARVVATHTASGVKSETITSDAGLYVIPSLQVGIYEVSVEITGFKKVNRVNVEIRIATRQELDVALEIGNMQETVDVTGEVALLETTSSQRGQSVSTQFMNTLPFFSRRYSQSQGLRQLYAGCESPRLSCPFPARADGPEVLIDGASATIPESGGTSFNFPAAEMFGEFKLLTSTFDAEYGRFGGGVELYVTKSGTNQFHGTAFLNARRDIWNANAWANNAAGRARPKDRFNEYGGALGGPVWIPKVYDGRNKTFYFFTYSKDKRPVASEPGSQYGADGPHETGRFQRASCFSDHLRPGDHVREHTDAFPEQHHSAKPIQPDREEPARGHSESDTADLDWELRQRERDGI